jgi:hypothetical protein
VERIREKGEEARTGTTATANLKTRGPDMCLPVINEM